MTCERGLRLFILLNRKPIELKRREILGDRSGRILFILKLVTYAAIPPTYQKKYNPFEADVRREVDFLFQI